MNKQHLLTIVIIILLTVKDFTTNIYLTDGSLSQKGVPEQLWVERPRGSPPICTSCNISEEHSLWSWGAGDSGQQIILEDWSDVLIDCHYRWRNMGTAKSWTPGFQISLPPAQCQASKVLSYKLEVLTLPSEVIKMLSWPANDNNKQLTTHETRNQNFLLVCMLKLGEMPVNELKTRRKKNAVAMRRRHDGI